MKLLVFFFVAASIVFLATEACSPSPSGGASSGGPSTGASSTSSGASSTTSATSTTTKEEPAARKRRAVPSEESVSAVVHTKIAFEDEVQAKTIAGRIGDQIRYAAAKSGDVGVEKVHKSVANVDGNVAILYRLKGENVCEKVMAVAGIGVTYSDMIAKIEVDCRDGQKKVFKKQ
ncbi:hypothetical protein QR680_004442 [Steinernema hermaphroditum]|uniref:Cystatin domain-containing protein n=1 Tax=Steinernema hermaphroditum TaxID=289476 RepID=A0AA39LU02_9BILA|nr:hypothetical protein QR680_004442 [Steinernema hermaphroditum]